MKRINVFLCFMFCLLNILSFEASAQETKSYEVYTKTYKRNSVVVEFPQIKGMSDMEKQKEINYLLEKEIFQYITDCYNHYWLGWRRKSNKYS